MSAASTRPYLVRAIYEWAVQNSLTPFVMVDTQVDGVDVPEQFIKDNSIVLNMSPTAVRDLNLGDEFISFSARFAGVSRELFVPIDSVRAVYAKENGEGIVLPPPEESAQPVLSGANSQTGGLTAVKQDSGAPDNQSNRDKPSDSKPSKKPHLTIVE